MFNSRLLFNEYKKVEVTFTMSNKSKTTQRGRSAKTGQFTTIEKARKKPSTHVVERVPKPGYGDTKKK